MEKQRQLYLCAVLFLATTLPRAYAATGDTSTGTDWRLYFYIAAGVGGAGWIAFTITITLCYCRRRREQHPAEGGVQKSTLLNNSSGRRINSGDQYIDTQLKEPSDEKALKVMHEDEDIGKTFNNPLFTPVLKSDQGDRHSNDMLERGRSSGEFEDSVMSMKDRPPIPPPVPITQRPHLDRSFLSWPGMSPTSDNQYTALMSPENNTPEVYTGLRPTGGDGNYLQSSSATQLLSNEAEPRPITPPLRHSQHVRPPPLQMARHQEFMSVGRPALQTRRWSIPDPDDMLMRSHSAVEVWGTETNLDVGKAWTSTTPRENQWGFDLPRPVSPEFDYIPFNDQNRPDLPPRTRAQPITSRQVDIPRVVRNRPSSVVAAAPQFVRRSNPDLLSPVQQPSRKIIL